MPTQMGRIALPLTSLSTTMGMLVTGSIIRPRIFISTSMRPPSVYTLADQRIRAGPGHANIDILAQNIVRRRRPDKIQRLMLRCAPDPLGRRLIETFDQALFHRAQISGVAAGLNLALQFLDDGKAADLFVLRDLILPRERRRIRAARVL